MHKEIEKFIAESETEHQVPEEHKKSVSLHNSEPKKIRQMQLHETQGTRESMYEGTKLELEMDDSDRRSLSATKARHSCTVKRTISNFSLLQESKMQKYSSAVFETPTKDLSCRTLEKASTPYDEISVIGLSNGTPKTIPKTLREAESEQKAGKNSACLFPLPPIKPGSKFSLSSVDFQFPEFIEETEHEGHSVDFLISQEPSIQKCSNHALTLVLDLDETLIYNRLGFGRKLPRPLLRPYLIPFLLSIPHNLVEVVVWTASTAQTAREVVDFILDQAKDYLAELELPEFHPDPSKDGGQGEIPRLIDHMIARNSHWYLSPHTEPSEAQDFSSTSFQYHTKDLRLLGRDLKKVLLVENSLHCCKLQPRNCVIVKDFCGSADSIQYSPMKAAPKQSKEKVNTEYKNFLKYLHRLESVSDVDISANSYQDACSFSETSEDLTLIRLSALVRKAVHQLADNSGDATVPNLLHAFSQSKMLVESEKSVSITGTHAFFMNYLGGQTFSLPSLTDISEEPRSFNSLNARINASIGGSFFKIPKVVEDVEGRHTV